MKAEFLKRHHVKVTGIRLQRIGGIGRFQVEMAGVFMSDLKRLMKEHSFNNQQEEYQNLLRNVIAAHFDTAARMLRCVTTPYEPSAKVSRLLRTQSLRALANNPGEPEDEIVDPNLVAAT